MLGIDVHEGFPALNRGEPVLKIIKGSSIDPLDDFSAVGAKLWFARVQNQKYGRILTVEEFEDKAEQVIHDFADSVCCLLTNDPCDEWILDI